MILENLTPEEVHKREKLKQSKPYVYEKVLKFPEKIARGESIAIIQLQYSYACNMRCQHCSIASIQAQGIKTNRKTLTPKDVRFLSIQADKMGLARFEINGGEPFVNKDYDKLVEAIEPSKYYMNSVTNAWFLDLKKAQHLKTLGIDRIQIGLDSLDPQEHDTFRRKRGAHEKALQAVNACIDASLDVFVTTVVTKQRLYSKEFKEFIEYFNKKNVGVFITFAKPVGSWQNRFDILVDEKDIEYSHSLELQHNVFSHLTGKFGRDNGCMAFRGLIAITPYGDVLPCQYIFVSLGNIFEEPLETIIVRGMKLKPFKTDTCPIAVDRDFINKYIVQKVYDKPLPVSYKEVFTEEDFLP